VRLDSSLNVDAISALNRMLHSGKRIMPHQLLLIQESSLRLMGIDTAAIKPYLSSFTNFDDFMTMKNDLLYVTDTFDDQNPLKALICTYQ
jgi:hypothetical protein